MGSLSNRTVNSDANSTVTLENTYKRGNKFVLNRWSEGLSPMIMIKYKMSKYKIHTKYPEDKTMPTKVLDMKEIKLKIGHEGVW